MLPRTPEGIPPDSSSSAKKIYADFTLRRERGERPDFETLCLRHPAEASDLRALHATSGYVGAAPGSIRLDSVSMVVKEEAAAKGPEPAAETTPHSAGVEAQNKSTPDLPHEIFFSRRYTLREEVARGGMGVIRRVWDQDLKRQLAMKVMLGEESLPAGTNPTETQRILVRFLEEAQITGQLDHPGVVPVHDVGVDSKGRGFFTMPLVRGRNLHEVYQFAREKKEGWTQTRVLGVLLRVCEAVAYAHSKGVIHRDLKPSNIMVGRFGEIYVMDWGLAKIVGRGPANPVPQKSEPFVSETSIHTDRNEQARTDPSSPLITLDGSVVGTPAYMPPEQAEGRVDALDGRSDVYAVGAMLYELLTGQVPYVKPGARLSPHTIISMVIHGPPSPISTLSRETPPELVAICDKAMARELSDRYSSIMEFAEDLRAFLEGHVVHAYQRGVVARFKKWVARNKAMAGLIACMILLVLAGTLGYVWMQRKERNEALRRSYLANIISADVSLRANEVPEAKRRLAACDKDLQGWEWLHLSLQADSSLAVLVEGAPVNAVAFGPDGRTIASGSADGLVHLRGADLRSAGAARVFQGHEGPVTSLAFSADRKLLASGSVDNTVRIWDLESGESLPALTGHEASITSVAFSRDGARIASSSTDGTARVWGVANGKALQVLGDQGGPVNAVSFSPAAERLASAGEEGSIRLWEGEPLKVLRVLPAQKSSVTCLAYSNDGKKLVSGSLDGAVRVWNPESGELVLEIRGHSDPVQAVAFSPDGSRIASGSFDKTVRLWDAGSGSAVAILRGHDQPIRSLAFSPDGSRLISGSTDASLRLWEATSDGAVLVLRGPDENISSVAVSPDSQRIAAGSRWKGAIQVWEASSGSSILKIPGRDDAVNTVAFSPDGSRIAAGLEEDATVWIWEARSGRLLKGPLAAHKASITSVAFSSAGGTLLSGSTDGTIRSWDVESGAAVQVFTGHEDAVRSVRFAPDGKRIASGSSDRTVRLWEAATGKVLHVLAAHEDGVDSVAFSPDGSKIVSGSLDRTVRIWDARSGKPIRCLTGHEGPIYAVSFSPDGSRVGSASFDKTLRLWEAATGELLLTLRGHARPVSSLSFSPDGTSIVSGSFDNTVRIWKTRR